jgi:hypothetical protein
VAFIVEVAVNSEKANAQDVKTIRKLHGAKSEPAVWKRESITAAIAKNI